LGADGFAIAWGWTWDLDQITQDPRMWQFGIGGPDMERLVAGRERIYLDRFWIDFSHEPGRFDEAKRQHYATLYAMMRGAIRAGFVQFAAFRQDAIDDKALLARSKHSNASIGAGGARRRSVR
jgi:hypothetical protein